MTVRRSAHRVQSRFGSMRGYDAVPDTLRIAQQLHLDRGIEQVAYSRRPVGRILGA